MSETISCPNCGHQIGPNDLECINCGVNPAIAAILVENELSKQTAKSNDLPLAPEVLVPRLGDYLIENELLKPGDLESALRYQKDQSQKGNLLLLGQILVTQGMVEQTTLDKAVTEQIVILQDALIRSNQHLEQRVYERTSELQTALEKLRGLNQLKANFVSNISHELRTPLAHMTGYIDLLREGDLGPLTEDQKHAAGILSKSYSRLHNLIDDLIEFSMVSEGEMNLDLQLVDIANLIQTAATLIKDKADAQGVKLFVHPLPTDLQVTADSSKIIWVLEELLENAIKFNQSGGKVEISAKIENGNVNFLVIDDGIGIEPDKIEEAFEPFHQLDGSSSRQYGGTGIGLSLARKIIEAHGTTLKIESEINQGSRIKFALPLTL